MGSHWGELCGAALQCLFLTPPPFPLLEPFLLHRGPGIEEAPMAPMVEVTFLFFPVMLGWFGEDISQGSTREAKTVGDKYEEIYYKELTYMLCL